MTTPEILILVLIIVISIIYIDYKLREIKKNKIIPFNETHGFSPDSQTPVKLK